MSSIDTRVVEMRFDNQQFERGIRDTASSLKALQDGLQLDGIDSDKFNQMANDVENVSSKFNVLGAVGFAALQKLTQGAMDFGSNMISKVLDPIREGGSKRALNLEQAKFQFEGLGMDVEKSMESALGAVEGTAFGLDEAAVLAANFGATGMQAGDEMTAALRGVSGVASMAGASYGEIGNVFGKVAGQGRLMGDDLNRLAARGVNAAATLANEMGTTETAVREMVSNGEISFEQFAGAMNNAFGDQATKANETYTGALSNMNAALARIGAAFATVKFEKHRQMFNALSPVIDKIGRALEPVVDLYTELSMASAENFVNFLEGINFWPLIKAAPTFVKAFKNVIDAITAITGPIGEAFMKVFSSDRNWKDRIDDLLNIAKAIESFTSKLIIGKGAMGGIESAFVTFFSILKSIGLVIFDVGRLIISLVVSIVKIGVALLSAFLAPLGAMMSFGDGLGEVEFSITDIIDTIIHFKDVAVEALLTAIDWLAVKLLAFSDTLVQVRAAISGALTTAVEWLTARFEALRAVDIVGWFDGILERLEPLVAIFRRVQVAWANMMTAFERNSGNSGSFMESLSYHAQNVLGWFKDIWNGVKPLIGALAAFLTMVVETITGLLAELDLNTLLAVINTGLFAALILAFRNFIKDGSGIFGSLKGMIDGVSDTLDGLANATKKRDSLGDTLIKIGIALILFAGGLLLLSYAMDQVKDIEWDELGRGLAALAGGLALMVGATMLLTAFGGQVIKMAFGLLIFSAAVWILSHAMKSMAALDWDEIGRGLTGLAGAMVLMVGAAVVLSKAGGSLTATAIGLLVFAVAITVLAGALMLISLMSWEQIAKGLTVVGALLLGITASLAVLSANAKGTMAAAASIAVMAGALTLLAGTVILLGNMNIEVLNQGMQTLAIMLAGLTVATMLLGASAPRTMAAAAAIAAMAFAMTLLVAPIMALGLMNINHLTQGLQAVAIGMGILVVAANLMTGAIKGAGAMVVMAGALIVLSAAVGIFGAMDPEALRQGLFGLAAGLLIVGAAGILLNAAGPGLLMLAAAMLVLSLAAIAFSFALMLFGPAAVVAAAGISALAAAAENVLPSLLPLMGLGGVLVIFGLGAIVAAIGITAMAVGLTLLGVGLTMISLSALTGATALTQLVMVISDLLPQAMPLLAMSGVFLLLGVAIAVLGAGTIIAAIGMGLLAAAVWVLSIALMQLHAVGPEAIDTMIYLFESLLGMIPKIVEAFGAGFLALVEVIVSIAPVVIEAFVGLVIAILDAIQTLVPKFIETFGIILSAILTLIQEKAPQIGETFRALLMTLLGVIESVGPQIVAVFTTIVLSLLAAAEAIIPQMIATATRIIMALLQAIQTLGPEIIATLVVLVLAMVDAIVTLVPQFVIAALAIIAGVLQGIAEGIGDIIAAGVDIVIAVMEGIAKEVPRMANSAAECIIEFVNGLATAVDNNAEEMRTAGKNLAGSIISGITGGLADGITKVVEGAKNLASGAVEAAKGIFRSNSPSKVFIDIGHDVGDGLVIGMKDENKAVVKAAEDMAKGAVYGFDEGMTGLGADMDLDVNPSIRPILDLSEIDRGLGELDRMLESRVSRVGVGVDEVTAGRLQNLSSIGSERRSAPDLEQDERSDEETKSVVFNYEQHNHSPKALSEVEVYRNTKNQLSTVKGALGV